MSIRVMCVAIVAMCAIATAQPTTAPTSPERWEKDIAAFEASDRANMPAPGGVVFVGSSTIRMWDLKNFFPNFPAINRGFGGSEMSDAAHFATRIVTKYKPRLVVLYSGDNDMHAGKSAQVVADDMKQFANTLHAAVPDAKLIVLAIKPSGSRWSKYPEMRDANELFAKIASGNEWITVLDMAPLMLDASGKPRAELFREDQLHLNDQGYLLWSDKLRPMLAEHQAPGNN